MRQSPEAVDPGPIVHLHEIDPRYLIELGLLRLEIARRAAERRIARAAELLDKPALGWYRRRTQQDPAS